MYNKNILIMQFGCQGNSYEFIELATIRPYPLSPLLPMYHQTLSLNPTPCHVPSNLTSLSPPFPCTIKLYPLSPPSPCTIRPYPLSPTLPMYHQTLSLIPHPPHVPSYPNPYPHFSPYTTRPYLLSPLIPMCHQTLSLIPSPCSPILLAPTSHPCSPHYPIHLFYMLMLMH